MRPRQFSQLLLRQGSRLEAALPLQALCEQGNSGLSPDNSITFAGALGESLRDSQFSAPAERRCYVASPNELRRSASLPKFLVVFSQ
jgi:hypothetical protein